MCEQGQKRSIKHDDKWELKISQQYSTTVIKVNPVLRDTNKNGVVMP